MSDNKPRVGNITQLTQSNDRLRHDLREAEAALKLGVRRNIQRVRDQQKGVAGLAEELVKVTGQLAAHQEVLRALVEAVDENLSSVGGISAMYEALTAARKLLEAK